MFPFKFPLSYLREATSHRQSDNKLGNKLSKTTNSYEISSLPPLGPGGIHHESMSQQKPSASTYTEGQRELLFLQDQFTASDYFFRGDNQLHSVFFAQMTLRQPLELAAHAN